LERAQGDRNDSAIAGLTPSKTFTGHLGKGFPVIVMAKPDKSHNPPSGRSKKKIIAANSPNALSYGTFLCYNKNWNELKKAQPLRQIQKP